MLTCTDDDIDWITDRKVRTHCRNGHDLREVGVYSRGQCAECGRIKGRRYLEKHRDVMRERAKARYHKNRDVELALNKQWREANNWSLTVRARKYGLEKETLGQMLKFDCGICGGRKRLVIDHDHDTGAVRGVLCDKCNKGLGFFQTEEMLQKAIGYLRATGLYSAACAEATPTFVSAQSAPIRSVETVGEITLDGGLRL